MQKSNPGFKPGKNDKAHSPRGNPHGTVGSMDMGRKHQSHAGNWIGNCNQGVHGMKSPRPTPVASRGA